MAPCLPSDPAGEHPQVWACCLAQRDVCRLDMGAFFQSPGPQLAMALSECSPVRSQETSVICLSWQRSHCFPPFCLCRLTVQDN